MNAREWIKNWENLNKERPVLNNGLTGISGLITDDGIIQLSKGSTDYFMMSCKQAEVVRDWLLQIFPLVDSSLPAESEIKDEVVDGPPPTFVHKGKDVPFNKEFKIERAFLKFGEKD